MARWDLAAAVILYCNLMKFSTVSLKCISDQISEVQTECLMQMSSKKATEADAFLAVPGQFMGLSAVS